ncbi:MAG: ABC transporter permease [Faecousia sp.]
MIDSKKITDFLKKYIVTILFLVLSLVFIVLGDLDMTSVARDLMKRLSRNAFIVLSLIIPIVAGMGINFAITIGAMAAQIGLLLAINWNLTGPAGILVAAAITLPLGILFGYLVGVMLNKMKGQETIGSMILGYFANGAYQLLFLYIFGNFIPLNSKVTIIGATGVKNTLDLTTNGLAQAIDGILRIPFLYCVYIFAGAGMVYALVMFLLKKISRKKAIVTAVCSGVLAVIFFLPPVANCFNGTNSEAITVPGITWVLILLLCGFNVLIMKTRLGQKFRAVGQSQTVANASGINVNRVRLIAIMISTVLAGWGQLLFIQSDGMGTLTTYSAHEQVGLYAGAAILVGGASIDRATNSQALLGTVLFHLMFLTVQKAASALFGDAVIGEYFRAFLSYAVIAVALVMYAWKGNAKRKKKQKDLRTA